MKTKKFYKKLALNKGTIAHLNGKEKQKIKGGCADTDPSACDTYDCYTTSAILCCASRECETTSVVLCCAPTRVNCPTYSGDPCCL